MLLLFIVENDEFSMPSARLRGHVHKLCLSQLIVTVKSRSSEIIYRLYYVYDKVVFLISTYSAVYVHECD